MLDGTERSHSREYANSSEISGSEYAARTRRLIQLIKDLRALG
jgi:hypothetical protein